MNRHKMLLSDLQVETFEITPALHQLGTGTVIGYIQQDTQTAPCNPDYTVVAAGQECWSYPNDTQCCGSGAATCAADCQTQGFTCAGCFGTNYNQVTCAGYPGGDCH